MGAGLVVAGLCALMGVAALAFVDMPSLAAPTAVGRASTIYDRSGQVVTAVPGPNLNLPLDLSQIPPRLQDAFVAVEDRRFYSNGGIDVRGLARAAAADLLGRPIQGGSTITEQLVKNLYLTPNRTLLYKLQEIGLALQLARRESKPQILDDYLNAIYLGEHAYGVGAAARVYFHRTPEELDLAQEALLAGLAQSPSGYDPFYHPQLALERRNTVLAVMADEGYISRRQAERASAEPLGLVSRPPGAPTVPPYPDAWFVDAVVRQLEQQDGLTAAQLQTGGLRIYTTLEPRVQDAAEQAVATLGGRAYPDLQASEVVLDPNSGDVVALVGGRRHTAYLGYDRAMQAERQPGSAIKPLVDYIPALQAGLTPGTVVDDALHVFNVGRGSPPYAPVNDDGRYYGLTTLTEALRRSVNTVAVQLLDHVGVDTGWQNARDMGLPLAAADRHLALALGGTSDCCTALDMAAAYGAIANGGYRVAPRLLTRVLAPDGQELVSNPVRRRRVLDPQVSYVMTQMLETVDQPQPNHGWNVLSGPLDSNWGTGYDADVQDNVPGWPTAAKTGTTNDAQDVWYVGYTPKYAAAVWVGYDQPQPMPGAYGGTLAGPVFERTMAAALDGVAPTDFPRPGGVAQAAIDIKAAPWTVALPGPLTPPDDIRREWFVDGTQPTHTSPLWVSRQVSADDPTVLFDSRCSSAPVTRTFLARQGYSMDWAQGMADAVGKPWWSLFPVDQRLMPPAVTCAG